MKKTVTTIERRRTIEAITASAVQVNITKVGESSLYTDQHSFYYSTVIVRGLNVWLKEVRERC